jgi:hypothetical protein
MVPVDRNFDDLEILSVVNLKSKKQVDAKHSTIGEQSTWKAHGKQGIKAVFGCNRHAVFRPLFLHIMLALEVVQVPIGFACFLYRLLLVSLCLVFGGPATAATVQVWWWGLTAFKLLPHYSCWCCGLFPCRRCHFHFVAYHYPHG